MRSLDAQALVEVHDRYYPAIYGYIRFRVGDEQAAEDLASEVFVRLIEAAAQGKGPTKSIQGWLMGTAANLVADHHRRRYRSPELDLSEVLPDPAPSVDSLAALREASQSLATALAALTPDQQNVIALRFGAGLSVEETSAEMGKEPNAIKALQFRAMASLRRHLGEVSP